MPVAATQYLMASLVTSYHIYDFLGHANQTNQP